MKPHIALPLTVAALLMLAQAAAQGVEWKVWVNPREESGLHNMWIEIYSTKFGVIRGYTEEDGGYTFHVYFKSGPKIYWNLKLVDYNESYAAFAHYVVKTWNASLRFAAEHYEWGSHLSKLRLKFYTDANVSKAPYIDIIVDPTRHPTECPGFPACAIIGKLPNEIPGDLGTLPHELGHALGLGHNYVGSHTYGVDKGRDWRGWRVGGIYPAGVTYMDMTYGPPDTFVLYALAVRWSSLKNSTPGSPIEFPRNIVIYYRDIRDRLGPVYSEPGVVWAYPYTVYREGGVEAPYPSPFIPRVFEGLYGGDLCVSLQVFRDSRLPVVEDYGNDTALVLHGLDVQAAIIDREMWPLRPYRYHAFYRLPLKHLTDGLLEDLLSRHRNDTLIEITVYDSLGPAWDKMSGVSYRSDSICLEKLRERVLVEAQLGRAYRVDAGMAEAVPLQGWSYRDDNGNNWVLRGSTVYFKKLNSTYSPGEGVRYVWRDINLTLTVDKPVVGGTLLDKLWRKQYQVEVDSPFPFEGVGWFDEGSKIAPKPVGGYVDFGNGTRLALKGFQGYNGTEIVVDRPLKLNPVWERMHRVDTVSRYVFTDSGKYFKEGEKFFTPMPRVRDFGNGTKAELLNITAYGPSGEVVAAWDGKLGGEQMALLQAVLDRPLKIVVAWKIYHRLTVTSPVTSYEEWVLNGTVHRLDLPEKRIVGSDTLLALRQIKVNGRPHQGLELTVTSPASVEAVYLRKLMTTLMVDAGGGHLVEPEEVVLVRDGEAEVYRPPFTYISEGTWRVFKVVYLGRDVSADATIEVNIAGMRTLPSRLRAVDVHVVDILGIPVPYATVKADNTGGVTGLTGATTLPATPPWDIEATAYHALGSGKAVIRPSETVARITAGISPYTLVLLAAAATAGVFLWRRKNNM